MTNKLVVIVKSLKVPKLKEVLLYDMKFLVPNYSCLQNPWLGDYRPQIPVLSVLNWICWTPHPTKFPGYATALLSSSPWLLTSVYYFPHSPSARPSPFAFIFSHILWHIRLKNDHASSVLSVPLNRVTSNFKRRNSNTRTNSQAAKKIQTLFVSLFTAWLLGSTVFFDAHFTTLLTTALACKTNRAEAVFVCKISAENFAYLLNKRSRTVDSPP